MTHEAKMRDLPQEGQGVERRIEEMERFLATSQAQVKHIMQKCTAAEEEAQKTMATSMTVIIALANSTPS